MGMFDDIPAAKSGGMFDDIPSPKYNAAADTPAYMRPLINVGSGLSSAIEAVKQFTHIGTPISDEEIKYRRGEDAKLSEQDPYAATGYRILGNTLPLLAIPTVGAGAASTTLARLAVAAANGAGVGGLAGALQPTTSGESRTGNVVMGAAAGAALPAAIGGGGALIDGIKSLIGKGGAQSRAGQQILDALQAGKMAPEDAIKAVEAAKTGPAPLSAAEATQSPQLGMLERKSATSFPAAWTDLRSTQAQTRYAALQDATQGAEGLGAAKTARDAATSPMREDALSVAQSKADEAGPGWLEQPIRDKVSTIIEQYPKSSPAYKVASVVAGDLENATPMSLYETRKVLASKLNGKTQIGDELSAAAKGARKTTMDLIDTIDNSIDSATGGAWSKYLGEYASASKEVNSASAQQLIRGAYLKNGAPQMAGVPQITGANLGKVMDRYGSNSYGATLDDSSMQALQALRSNVQQSEGLQKLLRFTGTSGGGSNTAMDMAAGAVHSAAAAHGVPTGVLSMLGKRRGSMTDAALSDALSNPDLFIAAVSKRLQANQPLTPSQDAVLTLMRGATAAIPEATGSH